MPVNQPVLLAIAKLSSTPSAEARAELYAAMRQGSLLLAGNADHLPQGEALTLAEKVRIDLLSTLSPSGGKALVAFTDFESLRKRTSAGGYIELSTVSVLELVTRSGYDGLIINPAGPWAGIPAVDIPKIIAHAGN